MAVVYVGLGEKNKALTWLERAIEDHYVPNYEDSAYDPLRSDPRFVDLLRRMNLQP
jgi:hypothetical protein